MASQSATLIPFVGKELILDTEYEMSMTAMPLWVQMMDLSPGTSRFYLQVLWGRAPSVSLDHSLPLFRFCTFSFSIPTFCSSADYHLAETKE